MAEPISAAHVRDLLKPFPCEVAPNIVFLLRRRDFPTLLLEGVISMPLLQAAMAFRSNLAAAVLKQGGEAVAAVATAQSLAEAEAKGEMGQILDLARRNALAVVITPKIESNVDEHGQPRQVSDDAIAVQDIPSGWLTTILFAQTEGVRWSEADATRFRETAPRPDGATGSPGEAIPAAPVAVAALEQSSGGDSDPAPDHDHVSLG